MFADVASVDGATSYPRAALLMLPKIRKVSRPHLVFIFPAFVGFPLPIHAGGPPYTSGILHANSLHIPARLSPYAGAVPSHVSTAPPYNLQAPKIPTLISTRPAFPAPQTRHPQVSTNSLRRLPARYRMSRRGTNPPRPATGLRKPPTDSVTQVHCQRGRSTQTCASNRSHHLPCASGRSTQMRIRPTHSNSLRRRGGHGRQRRRCDIGDDRGGGSTFV